MSHKNNKQITLGDIALELKISKVAVSKALRDHPDISVETKALVKDLAEKLGYMPNRIARNLSSRQSFTVGLVVPKIAHHFFAYVIEAIYETAYDNNYEIIMMVSHENADHEVKQIQTLLSMRVDGLLVSVSEQTKKFDIFQTIRKRNVPLVFFDRVIEDIGFSCVTTDDVQSSHAAVSQIIEAGYSKIGHLAGYQHTNIGKHRRAGYEQALKSAGIAADKNWIIEGGFAEQDGYRSFKKLIKSGTLPQVVFTVTYPVALGVLSAANEHGIKIPGDLELLSFGGSDYNRFIKPALTYIDQPAQEIGTKAMDLLLQEINSPGTSRAQNIKIPSQLVTCDTCLNKKGNQ